MFLFKSIYHKHIIYFLILCFRIIYCEENSLIIPDLKYSRSLQLNNGNIVIAGDTGIKTYDKTGKTLLYDHPFGEAKFSESTNARYTTLVQFPKEYKSLVIVLVMHILYILNSEGNYIFLYELDVDPSFFEYYSIVPYIYKDNKYHFILGYIKSNTKIFLQYYLINIDDNEITKEGSYEFDQDDSERNNVRYNYGISCQIMDHIEYKKILTCFYQNTYPEEVTANSFKLENNQIEKISELEASYIDKVFCIQSAVSPDRKKTILCYINVSKFAGHCSVYDIDKNIFEKYDQYLTNNCGTSKNHLALNYFKETKEYIFSCIGSSNTQINIIKFDQNYEVIQVDSENDSIFSIDGCYTSYVYSFIFISNEYKVLGHFNCNDQVTKLYSTPSKYEPLEIYPDSDDDFYNEDLPGSSILLTNMKTNIESSIYTEYKTSIPTLITISDNDFNSNLLSDNPDIFINSKTSNIVSNSITSSSFSSYINPSSIEDSSISEISSILSSSPKESLLDYNSNLGISSSEFFIESKSSNSDISSVESFIKSNIISTIQTSISTIINSNINPSTINECNGFINDEGTICTQNIPKGYYIFDILNKILKKCHISCESCEKGPEENKNNCLSCNKNFELNQENNCLYKYNYFYNKTNEEIIYLLSNQLCPESLPYEIIETRECVEDCSNEEFINEICKINYFSENNMEKITNKFKSFINESSSSDYDVIINGNNIFYEVTTTATSNDYYYISSIDFGECENILKKHYNIDYLLIFKIDIKLNASSPTVVEYEVYSPKTKEKLNLSLCNENQIDLYVPVSIDDNTNNLYNSVNKYGYDILNENSSFYNDICTPFSTKEGTDIILTDRQNDYYNENVALCEKGCSYIFFNSTSKKAKCQCQIKQDISNVKTLSFSKMGAATFLDIKTLANIEIIKCYKLPFTKEGEIKNYGSFILIFMIICYIILIIYFFCNEKTSISNILRKALNLDQKFNPPKISDKKIKNGHSDKNVFQVFKKNKNKGSINKFSSQTLRDLIDKRSLEFNKNPKLKNSKKLSVQIKNYHKINVIQKNDIVVGTNKNKNPKNSLKKIMKQSSSLDVLTIHKLKEKMKKDKIKEKKIKNNNETNVNVNENSLNYNDEELNTLPYKEAIIIDKRGYFKYYWSLIKKKHIVLFIFMPSNDYNLISIKIALFIFSFCLYFTINALFFTDSTMHKIYEDKGIFNILFQLPHILYSTLISSFINLFIKKLALSERDIIKLKHEKNKNKILKNSCKLFKTLIIKFNLFFFISLFLLILFWYYITIFCAVYKNTKKILIENSLISFGLSLLYPFGLNLLPGIFRIPSIKAKKKDKECLYKFSNIVALI